MPGEKILIIGSDQNVESDLKEKLQGLGYSETYAARDVESAREKITNEIPDLILMDVKGILDAPSAAGELNSRFGIPTIYLLKDSKDLQRLGLSNEYDSPFHIFSPFQVRELQAVIEATLYRQKTCKIISIHENSLKALLNATKNGLLLLDGEGQILAINETMATRSGKAVNDLIHRPITLLLETNAISPILAEAIINTHSSRTMEMEEEFQGRWYENSIYPIMDDYGVVHLIAVYSHDISDRKLAEMELKQMYQTLQKEKDSLLIFQSVIDNMDDVSVITNPSGEVIYVNHAFERRIGFSLEEMKGRHLKEIQAPGDRFALDINAFIGDKKSIWNGQLTILNKNGLRIPLLLKSSPIFRNQSILCRVFVFREKS